MLEDLPRFHLLVAGVWQSQRGSLSLQLSCCLYSVLVCRCGHGPIVVTASSACPVLMLGLAICFDVQICACLACLVWLFLNVTWEWALWDPMVHPADERPDSNRERNICTCLTEAWSALRHQNLPEARRSDMQCLESGLNW